MPFNARAFERAEYALREDTVELPALAPFFDEGEKPVFKIRQLQGEELARISTSIDQSHASLEHLVTLMHGNTLEEKADAVARLLGCSLKDVPVLMQKQIAFLVTGVVEPKLDRLQVVRLFAHYPYQALMLFRKIDALTGEGAAATLKPASSGQMTVCDAR